MRIASPSVRSLTHPQRRTVARMSAAVVGLHVVGFGLLVIVAAPHHLGASAPLAVGTGLTAYTLGLRHAFDADHVAAIDNTTRKLVSDGGRPMSVGFFFSLGHSTIVLGLALLFAAGIKTLSGPVRDPHSQLHGITGWLGTGVSGTFLYAIAAVNIVVLWGIVRVLREMRDGRCDEAELERGLAAGGPMNRFLGRLTRLVRKPWHAYPLGLLFGLGFDTASEVALLFLAAGAAGAGLSIYAILCLPVLFAAGMSLLDTIDGSFMQFAYGWAVERPVRKLFYNLIITGLSVAVALLIGTIELSSLLAQRLGAQGGFWSWLAGIDMNALGLAIVGLFVATWALAAAIWRFGHIEERWSTRTGSRTTAGGTA
ncbi:MAG TPA: HoxN/HupN/NixA family nickel/cobalt transporter [Solirubrobacteraceae bacterium]|jgi:high-affinity nickel-transport protein|nr:HoxN/HupN/NixA family nickel/cobalt transporter [Solirubrobacteraceae bacterium]